MRKPKFENLLKVLRCEAPDRPTLFEFFLNEALYKRLAGPEICAMEDKDAWTRVIIHAYANAGYDYVTIHGSSFGFKQGKVAHLKSKSLNDGALIPNREAYRDYVWNDPRDYPSDALDFARTEMPEGMKAIVWGPGGVLENVIALTGYDNLCYMLYEDPGLVQELFDQVGSRLVTYYERVINRPEVGAMISNDDWGFNTQTMLAPDDMRKYVFPWHQRIVDVGRGASKPVILHSCGFFEEVAEDVIAMGYSAKHSYEDNIMPVEDFYEKYKGRIAVLGGIDLDFVCTKTPEQIVARCKAMLERAAKDGGYALGTGNSVPYYVPEEKYLAMISAID